MKIALIIHRPQPRGQEIFASLLGNWLIREGKEVLLVSLHAGDFALPFSGKQVSLSWNSGAWWKIPPRIYRLAQVLRDFAPDIVQANGGDTLKFTVLARLAFAFPGKLVFNNGGVLGYYLRSGLQRSFNQFLLQRLDGIISISDYSARDIRQLAPASIPQTQIPIGLETDRAYPLDDPTAGQVFVHVGGFTPEKNHAFLLEIFEKYRSKHPQSQLLLIGEGPGKGYLENKVGEWGVTGIRFLGACIDPWSKVPENAILLLPSKIEGMPSVIVEALLAKIPVIAAPVGGIPEMMEGMPACSLVELTDSGDWISAMEYWTNLPLNEKRQLSEGARLIVKNKFGLSKAGRGLLEFYRTL